MDACTPERHVFAGWILGTPCRCGATVVTLEPQPWAVVAKPVAAPTDTLAVEMAADAAQAESEADQEAEDALGTPRRSRKR